jgi:hypothetical protein
MKTSFSPQAYSAKSRRWLIGLGLPLLAFSISASAELGGDVASVQNDQARMKATLKVTEAQAYTVQEITSPEGTVVKEFVSPAGKVFAVVWKGHFMPDLQQLLGTYFVQFSQAAQSQQASHRARRVLSINEPGLVVQSAGRMRSYHGRAYVPEMIPQGVGPEVIQ